jgi:hypothetical protein
MLPAAETLKQFQQECGAVLRPELRKNEEKSISAIRGKAETLQ